MERVPNSNGNRVKEQPANLVQLRVLLLRQLLVVLMRHGHARLNNTNNDRSRSGSNRAV